MNLKFDTTYRGFVFVFLFVFQQILAFVYSPVKLVSYYWIVILILIFVVSLKLPLINRHYQLPLTFVLISVFGSILTHLNGSSIGDIILKMFSILIGYVGFVYISFYKINLRSFDLLLVLMYIFFYFTYISLDQYTRRALQDNLFDHSSANTISICLNVVLFLYYILSKNLGIDNRIRILLFAIINLIFIFIQNSRAGILVALSILFLAVSDLLKFKSGRYYKSYLFVSFLTVFLGFYYYDFLLEFSELNKMQGIKAYQEDIRSKAQSSFFSNMDLESFLIGYNKNFEFTSDITRTFNGFLDFWSRYGLLPFILFVVLFLRRIFHFRRFKIPIIYLLPFIIYTFFESFWGASMWDVIIYIILFEIFINNANVSYLTKNPEKVNKVL